MRRSYLRFHRDGDNRISTVASTSIIIATTAISIALVIPCVICQHRKHHVSHLRSRKAHRTLFAQPPLTNTVEHKRRTVSGRITTIAPIATPQPEGVLTGNCSEPPRQISQPISTLATRQIRNNKRIRFVSWAGKRGMLPHQHYSGVLNHEEFCHWLRIPLGGNTSIPTVNVENYFSTASPPSTPMENATSLSMQQITPPQVTPNHLRPIYIDEHIIVVNKPSGVLSVPGPRRHECVASLAYRYFGKSNFDCMDTQICDNDDDHATKLKEDDEAWQPLTTTNNKQIDTMVVHRLDRDTSGVLMFARNDRALKQLHGDFKDKARKKVNKRYVALVCGHWRTQAAGSDGIASDEGEIDLPLVRDMECPPFMRVATVETRMKQQQLKQQSQQTEQNNETQRHQHSGYMRMVGKGAKESMTTYRILSYEYLIDKSCNRKDNDNQNSINNPPRLLPVTRVELTPVTGRTHQLRVHCAAVGHPIVGDSIYGYGGEGSAQGGLECDRITNLGASLELQKRIHLYWLRRLNEQNNKDGGVNFNGRANEECMLCLHAHQLTISHPFTESPMIFECPPPF